MNTTVDTNIPNTAPVGAVRTVTFRELTKIVRILVASFENDSAFRWIARVRFVRAGLVRYLMFVETLGVFMLGRVDGWYHEDRLVAVCLWRHPDKYPFPWYTWTVMAPLALPFFLIPVSLIRLSKFQEAAKTHMPLERKHWYVGGLAVDPEFRNSGIGSALLRSGLPHPGTDDRPAVLSCWSELVGYYEQLGFSEFKSTELKGYNDRLHGLWMLKAEETQADGQR